MSLADKTCQPCRGGVAPLTREQFEPFLRELCGWVVAEDSRLRRSIKTENFAQALAAANRVGAIAEEQDHHPDLLVRWGELSIELWTHAIGGLSEADFILASKIDRALAA